MLINAFVNIPAVSTRINILTEMILNINCSFFTHILILLELSSSTPPSVLTFIFFKSSMCFSNTFFNSFCRISANSLCSFVIFNSSLVRKLSNHLVYPVFRFYCKLLFVYLKALATLPYNHLVLPENIQQDILRLSIEEHI